MTKMTETGKADKAELLQDIEDEAPQDYGSIAKPGDLDDTPSLLTTQLVILVILSVISGFLFGYDTGIVSGAMLAIKVVFNLSYSWQELIVSVTVASAAVSSVLTGLLSDAVGRKAVIMISSATYAAGAVLTAAVNSRELLLVGRLVLGVGIGLSSMVVPIYISEASPKEYRGFFTAGFNFLVTIGQTLSAIAAALFFPNRENGWRYMFGCAAIPAVIQFIGFVFMPESPRFLVAKGKDEQAKKVLHRLRPPGIDVDDEVEKIRIGYDMSKKASESHGSGLLLLVRMLRHGPTRRALLLGCSLQMFQQLVGINTVIYYMATILQMAGVRDPQTAVWVAAAIATMNSVAASLGIVFIERLGRRRLTLISLTGVTCALIILAVGFQVSAATSPAVDVQIPPPAGFSKSACSLQTTCDSCVNLQQCGFCFLASNRTSGRNGSCLPTRVGFGENSLYGPCRSDHSAAHHWLYSYCPSSQTWIGILGLVAYVVTFAPGIGPIPWTVNSEIHPTWARGTGVAMSTGVNWSFNLLISFTFLSLTVAITRAGTFWLYAGIAFLSVWFFYRIMPETKGKSLEEMEELFSKPFDFFCFKV